MYLYLNSWYCPNLYGLNIKFEEPPSPPNPKPDSFNWEEFKETLNYLKDNKNKEKYIIIDTI